MLPYTSGTTGLPKGCMHTHARPMHNAVAGALSGSSTPENVSLVVVPMFHITGMVIDLLASPHFAQYDLSSLFLIGGGGAAMPQCLLEQYGLRYAEGYGLTETAAPSHNNPPDAPKQQCLGIPFILETAVDRSYSSVSY